MEIVCPELSAVTDTTATFVFAIGTSPKELMPYDAEVVIRPSEEGAGRLIRSSADQTAESGGIHYLRIEELEPDTSYDIDILIDDEPVPHDMLFFPDQFRTLATPPGELVTTLATISDTHFGEKVCGLGPSPDITPVFMAADEDPPYWRYMNELAVAEINAAQVDTTIVKGDLTGEGAPIEFDHAKQTLDKLEMPWHAVRGNHDAKHAEVDGMSLMGQPSDPVTLVQTDGFTHILIDTVDPGKDTGMFPASRLAMLADALDSIDSGHCLILGHHYTSTPRKRPKYSFGISRADSTALLDLLAQHQEVGGVLTGHTHRNRVRHFPQTGNIPHAEVCSTKDYPGAWAHYRIHEGGYIQEVRRTRSPKALRWAQKTKDMYFGLYRTYALGGLSDRCFTFSWPL